MLYVMLNTYISTETGYNTQIFVKLVIKKTHFKAKCLICSVTFQIYRKECRFLKFLFLVLYERVGKIGSATIWWQQTSCRWLVDIIWPWLTWWRIWLRIGRPRYKFRPGRWRRFFSASMPLRCTQAAIKLSTRLPLTLLGTLWGKGDRA